MARIEKDYYGLEEIGERWELPRRDLAYLAENGLLKVSLRLYGLHIEYGWYEQADDGQWFSILEEQTWFQGLKDLRPCDVYKIFHEGSTLVQAFAVPEPEYCRILQSEGGILVRRQELVVRREERDRIEALYGLGGTPRTDERVFYHRPDFSEVTQGNRIFRLGPIQAQAVRILYEAADTPSPWRNGKQILTEAGSSCTRMADLFKTQPDWRRLIQSDRRGNYRLNTKFS